MKVSLLTATTIFAGLALWINSLGVLGEIPIWTAIDIGGVVRDGSTGSTVPNAKVIVLLYRHPLFGENSAYFLMTDESGSFVVQRSGLKRFSRVIVQASAPGNLYDQVESFAESTKIKIDVTKLPPRWSGLPELQYATFKGWGVHKENVTFMQSR
ncbi:MAG: hypothetical protein WD851_13395 [Pirellulales bacterium]